jgi:hypothetical protein
MPVHRGVQVSGTVDALHPLLPEGAAVRSTSAHGSVDTLVAELAGSLVAPETTEGDPCPRRRGPAS